MGGGLGYVPSLHELSHRQIYEALSLYWHRRGCQHLLFVPAIQLVSKKIYALDTGYSVITTNKTSNILSTNPDKESYKTQCRYFPNSVFLYTHLNCWYKQKVLTSSTMPIKRKSFVDLSMTKFTVRPENH